MRRGALADAALFLVGEKGHQGDVGEGVLFGGGVGEPGGGDGVAVRTEKLIAKRAGHTEQPSSGSGVDHSSFWEGALRKSGNVGTSFGW